MSGPKDRNGKDIKIGTLLRCIVDDGFIGVVYYIEKTGIGYRIGMRCVVPGSTMYGRNTLSLGQEWPTTEFNKGYAVVNEKSS